MPTKRLYFIDLVRAFAILMMLQGHFIDSLLAPEFRDTNNIAYKTWSYFRGITAPTFFTISGLIFTYLLFKAKEKGSEKLRMRKGITRGIMLIGVGYLLRAPILGWLYGYFNTYFLVIDVLQIIGLSLILIVGLYYLCFKRCDLFSLVMLIIGFMIFVTEPLYRNLQLENVPLVFANYISKANGSIFTLLPWFGYIAFGASIASLFHKFLDKTNFKPILLSAFIILGYFLIEWSSPVLRSITKLTDVQLFLNSANYNYLFSRLGDVLLYFAFFYGFERYLKLQLLLKIGQKTLSIYIIHFIVLYGSFTGFGLYQIIGKTLNPLEITIGAIAFLVLVCIISFNYIKTNKFVYSKFRQLFYTLKGKLKT